MGTKYTLPGQPTLLESSGNATYNPGSEGAIAYWLMVVGDASATVTIVKAGSEGSDLTSLALANGQSIPIRSRNITVNSGKVLLSFEQ